MSTPSRYVKSPVFYREPPSVVEQKGLFEVFLVTVPENTLDPHQGIDMSGSGYGFLDAGPVRFTTKNDAFQFIYSLERTALMMKNQITSRLSNGFNFRDGTPILARLLAERFSHRDAVQTAESFSAENVGKYQKELEKYFLRVRNSRTPPSSDRNFFLYRAKSFLADRTSDALYNEFMSHLVTKRDVPSLDTCFQRVVDSGVMYAIMEEMRSFIDKEKHKAGIHGADNLSPDMLAKMHGTPKSVELIKLSPKQRKTLNTEFPIRNQLDRDELFSASTEKSVRWIAGNKALLSRADAEKHLKKVVAAYHQETLDAVKAMGYPRVGCIKHDPVLRFLMENYDTSEIPEIIGKRVDELSREADKLYLAIRARDLRGDYLYPENAQDNKELDTSLVRQRIADAMYNVAVNSITDDDVDDDEKPLFVLPLEIVVEMADLDPLVEEIRELTAEPGEYLLRRKPKNARVFYSQRHKGADDKFRTLPVPEVLVE